MVMQHRGNLLFLCKGGFDGKNPADDVKVGSEIVNTNSQGFDCSSATASGSGSCKSIERNI